MNPAQFLSSYLPLIIPVPQHVLFPFTEKIQVTEMPLQGSTIHNSIIIEESSGALGGFISNPYIYYPLPMLMMPYQEVMKSENKVSSDNKQQFIETNGLKKSTQKENKLDKKINNKLKVHDEYEPHIKLTILKPSHESKNRQPLVINENGLINSQRDDTDISIGKQRTFQLTNGEVLAQNDIEINDKSLDNVHCKLYYQHCFEAQKKFTPDFKAFLTICNPRNSTMWTQLPRHVLLVIRDFLRFQPSIGIQDMGTKANTYIRVKKEEPSYIVDENNYMVGAETYFHIISLQNHIANIQKGNDYFYGCLLKEVEKGVEIHGLSSEEWQEFHIYFTSKNKKSRKHFNLKQCGRPFLKAKFSTYSQNALHLFIASKSMDRSLFKIGRAQDSDVIIPLNTVSRKQSQIYYEARDKRWFILDGDQGKESANGTWESVQDSIQRQMITKQPSDIKNVKNQTEIKIGDSQFRVEFINFESNKKRKLNTRLCESILNYL